MITDRAGMDLKARNDEPALRPPAVDQLLGRKTRTGAEVRQMSFRGARPDADTRRRIGHRSASGDKAARTST
jgi:hypothetical protein